MTFFLYFLGCTSGPLPTVVPPTVDQSVVPGQPDSGDTDDSGDTADTNPVDTGPPGLGDPCDLEANACTEGAICCADCCATDAPPVCTAADVYGVCPLPDVYVDEARVTSSLIVETVNVPEGSCIAQEACVGGTGDRQVLRFTTTTPNIGTADLILGQPEANPDSFEWSECHAHWHYSGYAVFSLYNSEGVSVGSGHKQAFCVRDSEWWTAEVNGDVPVYNCGFQGLSVGWADSYTSNLDCQWVDVTGLAPGDYSLELSLNPEKRFSERDYNNNVLRVPVTLP